MFQEFFICQNGTLIPSTCITMNYDIAVNQLGARQFREWFKQHGGSVSAVRRNLGCDGHDEWRTQLTFSIKGLKVVNSSVPPGFGVRVWREEYFVGTWEIPKGHYPEEFANFYSQSK